MTVVVDYAVDMAEIPTLQEEGRLDPDGDGAMSTGELEGYRAEVCEDLRTGLRLRVDGAATPLSVRSTELSLPVGQAGLSTLRLRCVFRTAIDPSGHPRPDVRGSQLRGPSRVA